MWGVGRSHTTSHHITSHDSGGVLAPQPTEIKDFLMLSLWSEISTQLNLFCKTLHILNAAISQVSGQRKCNNSKQLDIIDKVGLDLLLPPPSLGNESIR